MIFLKDFVAISSTDNEVNYIHYKPFDLEQGLGKSQSELESMGVLVEELPKQEIPQGKRAKLHINPTDNSTWWVYEEDVDVVGAIKQIQELQKTADQKYKELDLTTATLDDVKAAKLAQLSEFCTQAIYDGFSSSIGHSFGFNAKDQANFTQQSVDIVIDGLADTDALQWKSQDAGVIDLTVAQFKTVIGEAKTHKLTQQGKYWQLEAQVNATTTDTNAKVDAINW